ncbi:MAG: bifunctional diaminohydroxyphosphoribosylaminopyrimidine deaminase/5-amino-6-(5-phosphoribosylamino)uracil reductase RibD [Halothiobacillaceae bacterium]
MPGWSADDARFMARAIELARQGWYTTAPNPRVGCLIVREGQVVGTGFHARAGLPHAEPIALEQAGDRARGATAYVTLEPCAHQGRTPPCAPRLVQAGVSRVVTAMEDPNPAVSGRGHQILRAAGVAVETGLLEGEARALNRGFIRRMQSGRPRVRVKLAASADGRTALKNGQSQWITGPAARQDVQRLRAESCAVLTGIESVLADGARMNVRLDAQALRIDGPVRQPLRVVLDSGLRLPPSVPLFDQPGKILIYHAGAPLDPGTARLLAQRAELSVVPKPATGGLDLEAILDDLGQRQVNELLVEAGPKLAGSFVQAGLVDELILYLAPTLLGQEARPLLALKTLTNMRERPDWRFVETRMVGEDLRLTLVPKKP